MKHKKDNKRMMKRRGFEMKVKALFYQKILGIINMLALFLVRKTANASCAWVFHQPEFPDEANKFKKVK